MRYVFKQIFENCSKNCKNELSRLATAKIILTYDEDFLWVKVYQDENWETIYKATYKFDSVIDWDTIKVVWDDWELVTVRMIGIDTPEYSTTRFWYAECYWEEAKNMLEYLLQNAQEVEIELDPSQWNTDMYWRMLWYIFYNWENINRKCLHCDMMGVSIHKVHKYQQSFKLAESNAAYNDLGLWDKNTCNWERVKKWEQPTGAGSPYYKVYWDSSSSSSAWGSSCWACWCHAWTRWPRWWCYYVTSGGKVYWDHACCSK